METKFLDYVPAISEWIEDKFALPFLNAVRNEYDRVLESDHYFIVFMMRDTCAKHYALSNKESDLIWVASKSCEAQYFKLKIGDKIGIIDFDK